MKNDDELAFMDDEVVAINNYFANHTMNMCDLGIALDFVTGLRPGELSGLKWIDITDNITSIEQRSGTRMWTRRSFAKLEIFQKQKPA